MENKYKVVASQDECAPDSLEYFKKDFEKIVGQSFDDWMKDSERTVSADGYCIVRIKGEFRLYCDAGEPWWRLEQLIPQPTITVKDGNTEENI
jgi:hypothetical protein